MKRIYISHPYTGNEEKNLMSSERIRAALKRAHPDVCFINPIGKLGGPDTDYCTALADALELLSACQGAVFCPGWEMSVGCRAERAFCMQQGIGIHELPEYLAGEA